MNEFQDVMVATARLPDPAYFDLDDTAVARMQTTMADAIDGAGGRIDEAAEYPDPVVSVACVAPAHVDMNLHQTVPLLVLMHTNGLRDWMVDGDANMLLVACNLETGAVRVIRPMDHDKRKAERGRSTDAPVPDAFEAKMIGTEIRPLDLLEFGFDASAGLHVALAVILFDVRSNVVDVSVTTGDDPTLRRAPLADASWFVQPQPYDGPTDRAFCELRVPGDTLDFDQPFAIQGHVRLTLPPRAPISRAGDGRLLPVTMVFVQKDRRAADTIDLLISVQQAAGMAEGGFLFDLREPGGVPEGRSMMYLVAGDQMAGPYPITNP
jgi:hypothetical protein